MAQKVVVIFPEGEYYPKDRMSIWFSTMPPLYTLGNLDLLRIPLTAIFCSRKCPGDAIIKAYDTARHLREKEIPVMSGFHTPVEKDLLEIFLKGKGPIVICPARGLEGMLVPGKLQERLEDGRLLFISIAGSQEKRITANLANDRNLLVAALANDWMFMHIEPGGSLENLRQRILSKNPEICRIERKV